MWKASFLEFVLKTGARRLLKLSVLIWTKNYSKISLKKQVYEKTKQIGIKWEKDVFVEIKHFLKQSLLKLAKNYTKLGSKITKNVKKDLELNV